MADKNFTTGALATAAKLAETLSADQLAEAAKLASALDSDDILSISELVDHIAEAPEGNILLAESIPLIREDGSDVGSIDLQGDEWVFVLAEGAEKPVENEKKAPAKPAAKKAPAKKPEPVEEPVEDEQVEDAGEDEDDNAPMALASKPAAKSAPRRPAKTDDDDF